MKFVWIIILAVIAWRMVMGRWPWQSPLTSRKAEALSHARNLLGVRPGATRQEIVDAHRQRVAVVHPDRGGRNEDVHEANAARDLLLEELAIGQSE